MTFRSHLWLLVAAAMIPLLVVGVWLALDPPRDPAAFQLQGVTSTPGVKSPGVTSAIAAATPLQRVIGAGAATVVLASLAGSLVARRLRRSVTWLHGLADALGHAAPPDRRPARIAEMEGLQSALGAAEARLPRRLSGIESPDLATEELVHLAADVALQVGSADRAVVYWLPVMGTGPALPAAVGRWADPVQLPLLPEPALVAVFDDEAAGSAGSRRWITRRLPTVLESTGTPDSALSVAMRSSSGELVGALFLAHDRPGMFGAREERMVGDLAARVGLVLDNRRLHASARRAEAAADLATRLQDHFLVTSAHNLRSPLNTISVWSELLRQRQDNPALFTRAVDTIQAQVRAEAGLVDDLLNVSRMIAEAMRLEPGAVALVPLVRSVVEEAERDARPRDVGQDLEVDAALPPVISDGVRLGEVLRTLVATAVRATPAQGRILVRVRRTDRRATVEIVHPQREPAGPPPEQAELAPRSSTSILAKGASFTTLRELVEVDDGTLEVERRAGSPPVTAYTLTLTFAPATWVGEPGGPSEPLPSLDGIHLLLVEDDPPARESLELLLAGCGARVTAVGSAEGARVALNRLRPDLVVSDLQLPGESGYALVEGLRARGVEPGAVPAIAVSAMAGERDRDRALAAGFQRHFGKPVAARQLVDAILALTRGHLAH